jgi:hypothetical protein
MTYPSSVFADDATGVLDGSSSGSPARRSAREVVADVSLRLAQLGWPVACEVERDERGEEFVALHRLGSDDGLTAGGSRTLEVGPASMGRANLVDAILDELRARQWNLPRAGATPSDDVRWCAPA